LRGIKGANTFTKFPEKTSLGPKAHLLEERCPPPGGTLPSCGVVRAFPLSVQERKGKRRRASIKREHACVKQVIALQLRLARSATVLDVTKIDTREELINALTEAAELEHGLLCQYLFAAFSMKKHPSENATWPQLELLSWSSSGVGRRTYSASREKRWLTLERSATYSPR
jgi:hypothetical protein